MKISVPGMLAIYCLYQLIDIAHVDVIENKEAIVCFAASAAVVERINVGKFCVSTVYISTS